MRLKAVERIWISNSEKVKHLNELVYDLAHLRNLVLYFIHKYHEKRSKWITSSILYSLLADRVSIKTKSNEVKMKKLEEVNIDNELAEQLRMMKEHKMKIDNNYLVQQMRQIERDFRSYFASMREYQISLTINQSYQNQRN